jgi:hypothetical protein
MIIPEVIENLEFKYLFVKSFKWQDTELQESLQGQPLSGRLYRSIYNIQTQLHKFVLGETTNLVVEKLQCSSPDFAYLCDVVEVTIDNILDLKITEEDLDQLNTWIESNNEDIRRRYNSAKVPNTQLIQLGNEMMEEEAQAVAMSNEIMCHLYHIDIERFYTVLDLITKISDLTIEETNDPTYELSIHPQFGTGVNLSNVFKNLSQYTGTDRRTNLNVEDLTNSIYSLVKEYEQKINEE